MVTVRKAFRMRCLTRVVVSHQMFSHERFHCSIMVLLVNASEIMFFSAVYFWQCYVTCYKGITAQFLLTIHASCLWLSPYFARKRRDVRSEYDGSGGGGGGVCVCVCVRACVRARAVCVCVCERERERERERETVCVRVLKFITRRSFMHLYCYILRNIYLLCYYATFILVILVIDKT